MCTVTAYWSAAARLCRGAGRLLCRYDHHPVHAEAVDSHPETPREESLAERHRDLAALRECRELAVGFRLVGNRQRQREALERLRPAGGAAVGGHHLRVTDLEARV